MSVPEAIVALRKALSETQQGLANKLDVSVSVIHKYEAGRVPEPGVLLRLKEFAEDNNLQELAIIFRDRMYKDMGVPDSWEGVIHFEPKNSFEKLLVAALLATFRSRILSHRRQAILQELVEPCEMVGNKIRNHQARLQFKRTFKGLGKLIEKNGQGDWDEGKRRIVFYHDGNDTRTAPESQQPAEKLSPPAQ